MTHTVSPPADSSTSPTPHLSEAANIPHAPHIWPIPDVFWRRLSVRAIDPWVAFVGPMTFTDQGARRIAPKTHNVSLCYVLSSGTECLYVGKTVNLCGRFSKHRQQKDWWGEVERLTILAIEGTSRNEAETASFYLERLLIADCRPTKNIAGVVLDGS